MRLPVTINLTTKMLAAGCALLAVLVTFQLAFPATLPEVAASDETRADIPEIVVPPAYVPPAFETFGEVLERPLLFADRRLPEIAVEQVEQAPREPLRLTLEGVALTSANRVALLRDQANNALVQVAEGMIHNGWTLERLDSDKAVFTRDGETTELPLEAKAGNRRR